MRGSRTWSAVAALAALTGAMLPWASGRSKEGPARRAQPLTAAPTTPALEAANAGSSSSTPEPTQADPEQAVTPHVRDTLVLLWYIGGDGVRYWLQHVRVHDDLSVTQGSRVPLPTLPDGWHYSGPLATSPDSCLLISGGQYSKDIIAYQWRAGQPDLVQIGSLCQSFYHSWDLEAVSYSRWLGHALVAGHAPEGLLDPPVVWTPGSESWSRLPQAYPALRDLDPTAITTARYSPDGSLLAVAAFRKTWHYEDSPHPPPVDILLLDLKSGEARRLAGPRQYVWDIAISPDNRELRWYDTAYVAALAEFAVTGNGLEVDEHCNAGIGTISLATGETSYRRLVDQSDETDPPVALTGSPLGQLGVHSYDGERLYYVSSGLVCFDRSSRQSHRLLENDSGGRGYLGGFAVLPPPQEAATTTVSTR